MNTASLGQDIESILAQFLQILYLKNIVASATQSYLHIKETTREPIDDWVWGHSQILLTKYLRETFSFMILVLCYAVHNL